jgi:hypothetical protein
LFTRFLWLKFIPNLHQLNHELSIHGTDYLFQSKDANTFAAVQYITLEATMNLKTHFLKTLFINKLGPSFKDYVLSQEQVIQVLVDFI